MELPAESLPRIVGRYAVYGEIASGGMGAVHFGRLLGPVGFARTVAVKQLHPERARDPERMAMLLEEARLAARIRHVNVVPTLDVVAFQDELLIVMDYVQGESFARLIRTAREKAQPIPLDVVSAVVCGVLHGLHAAHEASGDRGEPLGIVHRDVSPHNILVGADGVARVLDFGVAQAAAGTPGTPPDRIIGKPAYMAPEQHLGEAVDRRTDVYAAGAVLWEGLTRKRLFGGKSDEAVVNTKTLGPVEPPSAVVDGLPNAVDEVAMRALSREPAARFTTAREMAAALEAAIPVASPMRVAEWIQSLIGERLALRAERVRAIEAHSSGLVDRAMDRCADGDDAAFAELFDLLALRLYRYLKRGTQSEARAANLLEQVFDSIYRARATFPRGAEATSWGLAFAQRLVADAGPATPTVTDPGFRAALLADDPPESAATIPDALSPEVRTRVVSLAGRHCSLTRDQLTRQTAIYLAAAALVAMSLFISVGGLERRPPGTAAWMLSGGAAGWVVIASGATWAAITRRGRTFGPSRIALLATAVLVPVALFGWKLVWGLTCPAMTGEPKVKCFELTLAMAAVPLIALIQARRGADPIHPTATGAAIGAASGAWAGVLVDLWCPYMRLAHVFVGHVLPVVVLTLLGAGLGRVWISPSAPASIQTH